MYVDLVRIDSMQRRNKDTALRVGMTMETKGCGDRMW